MGLGLTGLARFKLKVLAVGGGKWKEREKDDVFDWAWKERPLNGFFFISGGFYFDVGCLTGQWSIDKYQSKL